MKIFFLSFIILTWASSSIAVNPDEVLLDPSLEKQAREISKGLRCLVCQNQSIDDSDSKLARDLRLLVRKRLLAGDSTGDVTKYIVSRYGEFVLLNPTIKLNTLILWFGPLIFIIIGGIVIILFFREKNASLEQNQQVIKKLSKQEKHRLSRILEDIEQ